MMRRNYIFDTIRNIYLRYGFQQIETPAIENLSTLEGKYGEEGDKLLFRILNSGPVFDKLQIPKTRIFEFITILDKIEKIGEDAVTLEFMKLEVPIDKIEKIKYDLFPTSLQADIPHIELRIENLKKRFEECNSQIGLKGIWEI